MAEGQKTHSETGHPQAPHEAFPPFDAKNFPSQILWFVIAFGAFYMLMSRVALPRMKAIIDERAAKIDSDLAAAQRRCRSKPATLRRLIEKTLAAARARSKELAQETQAKVKLEQDAKRQAIEAELDAEAEDGRDPDRRDPRRTRWRASARSPTRRPPPSSNISPDSRPIRPRIATGHCRSEGLNMDAEFWVAIGFIGFILLAAYFGGP